MSGSIDLCVGWAKKGEANGGTFAGVLRDLSAGEWMLTGEQSNVDLQSGIELTDIDTIRVVDGNTIVFPGYVAPIDAGTGGYAAVGVGTNKRYTLAGPDLWAALASRKVYPSPSTEPPWASSFDERSGVASTVAKAYIDVNMGTLALTDRQYPGITVIDRSAGLAGAWSGRLQGLDELVQRICREGDIVCALSIDFAGAIRIELRAARDRTGTTILSDQGDLVGIDQRRVEAKATLVIAGGQGALNARAFRTATNGATGAERKEIFSDQSALSTTTELQQSATATLAANAADWDIAAQVSTVAAQSLVYGRDYDLGDTIAAEIDGTRYPVRVAAVTVALDTTSGLVVRPALGVAAPDLLGGLLLDVANLQSRFDNTIA